MPLTVRETFPLTHNQAVKVLVEAQWTLEERRKIECSSRKDLASLLANSLKTHWYLGEKTFPLSKFYQRELGLGHEDDMVSLILADFSCRFKGKPFSLSMEVEMVKQHWKNQGVDPLTLERIF